MRKSGATENAGSVPPVNDDATVSVVRLVNIRPVNDHSPVGTSASRTIDPAGAYDGVGLLGEGERTECNHDSQCDVFHLLSFANSPVMLCESPGSAIR
jgi:hypothetical protein